MRAYLSIGAHNQDPVVAQLNYAWGDPGTEVGHALDSINTARTVESDGDGDVAVFIRIELEDSTNNADQNLTRTYKIQRRVDQGAGFGAWGDVTAASTFVQVAASTPTDGDPTTDRIAGSAETFIAGEYDEGDGTFDAITWQSGRTHTELLASLLLIDADLDVDDVVEIRVVESDDTVLSGGYTNTPSLTWAAAAAAPQTITPDPVAASFTAPDPSVAPGSVTVSPDPVTAALSTPTPDAQLGGLTVSPDVVGAAWSAVAPSLDVGSVELTPDAVAAALAVAGPSVDAGPLALSPDPATADWAVPDPTVTEGGEQTVSPDAVVGAWSIPGPSLLIGALELTPSPVSAAWGVASPSLIVGTVVLSPDPVAGAWLTLIPALVLDETVLTPSAVAAALSVVSPSLVTGPFEIAPDPVQAAWGVPDPNVDGGETAAQRRRRVGLIHLAGVWQIL